MTTGEGFDGTNSRQVEGLITRLKADIARGEAAKQDVSATKKQLTVAEDLLKINKLTTMTIPGEHGAPDMSYCTLAEAAGGVTEKVSLVSLDKVTTQLGHLRDAVLPNIDDYIDHRADYKLGTEAILKLPKHGKIEEVQREAMALNISRIMGLDTTRSSIMMHEGKPALFVPFDNIKLMSEFARGKTFTAFASSKTYEHYSTINPVGSGLQADRFIDDFGDSMGLFYVCSDTDSMGGYNQNKALRNSRSLFIFDQVVMPTDKFKLDSRLSLQPDQAFAKHTRHGQGRNRTLIEDSSLRTKFNSLINLLHEQQQISKYADRTANAHQEQIDRINVELRNPHTPEERKQLDAQRKQLVTLKEDAIKIRDVVNVRIEKIKEVFPERSPGLGSSFLFKALVVEKLMHNPSLYTDAGRPYKNPWTYRHSNPVESIKVNPENPNNLIITFNSKVQGDMVGFLRRAGDLTSLHMLSGKELEISRADLAKVSEDMLHPESRLELDHGRNYLHPEDLKQISKAYGDGLSESVLKLIGEYKVNIASARTVEEKLSVMSEARAFLINHIRGAQRAGKDSGFGMHVLKKLYFDFQQELQPIMQRQRPDNIDEAFSAALKLDQADMFYKVVSSAIRNDQIASPEFHAFLMDCINKADNARDHTQAVAASRELSEHAEQALATFELRLPPAAVLDLDSLNLDEVDPLDRREEVLAEQRQALSSLAPLTTSLAAEDDAGPVITPPEDIGAKVGV